jgi:hypothetical protein
MDWQGDLSLQCYVCDHEAGGGAADVKVETAEVDLLRAYRKRCKKSWLNRQYKAKAQVGRTRSMSYKTAKKDIDEKHPGENKKSYRDRLLHQTYIVAYRIALAITKASPEKRMQYDAATAVWGAEWEKVADDPTYVPQLPCDDGTDVPIQNMLAQFLSEFVDGINDYFVCRHPHCSNVCRKSHHLTAVLSGKVTPVLRRLKR